jgi:hypothetical protein
MDHKELTPTGTLILVQLIISQENWRSCMYDIATTAMSKFTQPVAQVWIYIILVIL